MIRFIKGVVVCGAIFSFFAAFLIRTDIAAAALQVKRSSAHARRVDELYNRNCARCHGPRGDADTPLGRVFNTPDLTDPAWWKANSRINSTRNLRSIVTKGKGGMPAFGKKLTRTEINLLVNRMRSLRK